MDALPEHWRVVALTMRGHGDSAKPEGGYDTATMAEDVAAAMEALGIGTAAIVGHSMGSLVAQKLALDHAGRVSKLVLIGAFASLKDNEPVAALWREDIASLRDPVDPAFVLAFQNGSVAAPLPAGFLETVTAESLKMPARIWRQLLRSLIDTDNSRRLGEIAAPTLILWGDRDAFAGRAEQDRLAHGIRGASLARYRGIGHSPHWENPRRAAADIVAFIGGERALAA
jgi:pimeloyl-ACP methyl ester carboxylesterase